MSAPPADETLPAEELPPEELRIALALNGGVSLAIWMGGVAYEINRLLRGESVYGQVCQTLGVLPRVDVLAGSSAGGINGAMLAAAITNNQSLAPVRDLWADDGSLAELLRSPLEKDPASLLDGDGIFLPKLKQAFAALCANGGPRPDGQADPPVHLLITTTLLEGTPGLFSDDFGNVLVEPDHHGTFNFEADQMRGTAAAAALALAARCSASFPGAFEASYVPIGAEATATQPKPPKHGLKKPDMDGFLGKARSQYTIDGGVLVNKPVGPALQLIYDQPASQPVRRVLVYINPSPSEAAAFPAVTDAKEPSLLQVLKATVALPRVESLSSTLGELRRNNQRVSLRGQRRDDLALSLAGLPLSGTVVNPGAVPAVSTTASSDLLSLARELYGVYRNGRRLGPIPHISRRIVAANANQEDPLKQTSAVYDLRQFVRVMQTASVAPPWTPPAIAQASPGFSLPLQPPQTWGLRPLERSAEVLLNLLKRAQRLHEIRGTAALRNQLGVLRGQVHECLNELQDLRAFDNQHWEDPQAAKAAIGLLAILSSPAATPAAREQAAKDLAAWADARMGSWLCEAANNPPADVRLTNPAVGYTHRDQLGYVAVKVARISNHTMNVLRPVLNAAPGGMRFRDDTGWAVRATAAVLTPAPAAMAAHPGDQDLLWLQQLLALDVCLSAYDEGRQDVNQEVELMQLSARGKDAFDLAEDADEKLTGLQLSHFGAFYKRSWRYNDWMWGRMDGAARLAQLLIDPERLRDAARSHLDGASTTAAEVAAGWVRQWALNDPDEAAKRRLTNDWTGQGQVTNELAFCLDEQPPPATVPASAMAVTRRLQLEILRQEMPYVDRAAEADAADNDEKLRPLEELTPYPPDKAVLAATRSTVRGERITDEVDSKRFLLLASQAAAAATTTLSAPAAGIGILRRVVRAVRGGALTTWFMAKGITGKSPVAAALTFALLAIGGALIAIALTTGNTDYLGLIVAVGVGALALGAVQLGPWRMSIILAIGVIAVVALLIGPKFAKPVVSDDYTDWRSVLLAARTPLIVVVAVVTLFLLGGTGVRFTGGDLIATGLAIGAVALVLVPIWLVPDLVSAHQTSRAHHRVSSLLAAGVTSGPRPTRYAPVGCVAGRLRPSGVVDTHLAVTDKDDARIWFFANDQRAAEFAKRQQQAGELLAPGHGRRCAEPPPSGAVAWVPEGDAVIELVTADAAVNHQMKLLTLVKDGYGLH